MRTNILQEVDNLINGEREEEYGDPKVSFGIIAAFWTVYLMHRYNFEENLDAEDVAIFMSLFKHGRMLGKNKRDNARDAIGYLALLEDRIKPKKEEMTLEPLSTYQIDAIQKICDGRYTVNSTGEIVLDED